MAKFLIYTPSYNERSGGIIVLHKLCHLLNDLGHEAYVYPYAYTYEINRFNLLENIFNFIKWSFFSSITPFKTNKHFNTPIFKGGIKDIENFTVVYPEIVFGNPLRAKNVVRWLLHQPGFHEHRIYYGRNELLFKFNSAIKDFSYPGSVTSSHELKVIHYPLEYYNNNTKISRNGYAYCVRKGKGKTFVKDHSNDILIDNLTHQKISEVFKRCEYFISYDTYTAYSIFAALCGCISVVVGDSGVSKIDWYPNVQDRYGIAYGMEDIPWACQTMSKVYDRVLSEETKSRDNVAMFVEECNRYFQS
ncbi:MAG: WavQ [Gammaproteobacteria bacterium]|nr:WavQ [Gammaproteobacteria bacterium]